MILYFIRSVNKKFFKNSQRRAKFGYPAVFESTEIEYHVVVFSGRTRCPLSPNFGSNFHSIFIFKIIQVYLWIRGFARVLIMTVKINQGKFLFNSKNKASLIKMAEMRARLSLLSFPRKFEVYSSESLNNRPVLKKYILFLQAFTGCNTTSAVIYRRKTKFVNKFLNIEKINQDLPRHKTTFKQGEQTIENLLNSEWHLLLGTYNLIRQILLIWWHRTNVSAICTLSI